MKKIFIAIALLSASPFAVMAEADPVAGPKSGPAGAGPPGYQAWQGQAVTGTEQCRENHVSAAAMHDQAAAHHRAAAVAFQSGNMDQAKEHSAAADKASMEAGEKSKVSKCNSQGL